MAPHPALAAALATLAIVAVHPLAALGTRARQVGGVLVVGALFVVAPLAGGLEAYQAWLIAVAAGTTALRATDYLARPPPLGARGHSWLELLVFLLAWPDGDIGHFLAPRRGPRLGFVIRRGALSVIKVLGAAALLVAGYRWGLPTTSAPLDHSLKLVEIYAVGSGASDGVVAFWALWGFHHPDAFDHLFRSRSVLEFWSRYDRWVFVWLKRHVFDRVGRRRPILAVMATFAFSGSLHAVLFALVVPGVAGEQLAFFLLQGVAALAGEPVSRQLRRRGPGGVLLARALTIGFVGVSSVLFLHGVDALASLHGRTGAWLNAQLAAR